MIRQATVEDISGHRVTRLHGRIIVVTRYYPRYLKKNLIHQYMSELAPTKALLEEFKEAERSSGDHDGAFEGIDYESKFTLPLEGLERLKELAKESETQTVYFVCHCKIGQCCHRELLMLAAEHLYGAKIAKVSRPYSTFVARLPGGIGRD